MRPPIEVAQQREAPGISLVERTLLLASPGLAYWLMHFQPIMQNGSLDPYIYTGYIHNFVDLFERYGATYYGVRFGTILPGQVATTLLGPIAGYLALRYLLALIAGLPFYALVRQRYGRPAAVAMLGLLLTSPFTARTLLWDYPDSTGVPFLFASICLYSIDHPRRRLLDAGAGVFAGLAIHSNVFTLAPLSIFFAAHATLWLVWRRPLRVILDRLLTVAAAIVLVSLLGAAYYGWRVGHWNIFAITVETSLWLTGGAMADWRVAGSAWVGLSWWVLTPVFLAAFALMAWLRRSWRFEHAVLWTSATAVTLFYYTFQFGLDGTFLQLFYYFSYTLPFVFLLLALVVAALLEQMSPRARWPNVGLLLAAAISPWVLYSFDRTMLQPATLMHYLIIVGSSAVLLVVATRVSIGRHVTAALAMAALGLMFANSFVGPRASPSPYKAMVNSRLHPTGLELDVYRVALGFMKTVPPLSERPGVIRFWYSNEPASNSMQSIQSTYLWGRSKVQREELGLPNLSDQDLKTIREPRVKWLGLLAENEEQLALGRAALLQHEIPYAAVERRVVSAGTYTLYIELLDLRKDP